MINHSPAIVQEVLQALKIVIVKDSSCLSQEISEKNRSIFLMNHSSDNYLSVLILQLPDYLFQLILFLKEF